MDDRRALELLAAELGATELDPADPDRCPICLAATRRGPNGHRALCLACTCKEMGASLTDNAYRIEARLTWPSYWRRVETYGLPWQNPGAWRTPKSRLK